MNLQKLKIILQWQLLVLFFFQTVTELESQPASYPMQIATSNHPLATAYNNGRRIVRDSNDHRYVVYQDVGGDLPIICFVHSAEGKVWSQPDTLAEGAFPSLAIDQANRLYLVWQAADTSNIFLIYSNDLGTTWKTPPINVSQTDSERAQFPVIEAGLQRLHLAWQQDVYLQPRRKIQEIFYTYIALDSMESTFAMPINISCSEHDSKFPSIAFNLVFEKGKLHLVWYDSTSTDSSIMAMIMYRAVDETLGVWNPPLSSTPSILSENCGMDGVHPAVSVGYSEVAHVVWEHWQQDRFHSFLIAPYSFYPGTPVEIRTTADPFICVDDVYLKSSALVWVSNDEVYYAQSFDGKLSSNDYILVSMADDVKSKYPGVCYKYFDQDSLDVVWTEGNTSPYKVMYRRMKKVYGYQDVEREEAENQFPQKIRLRQNYPNPFNSITTIEYKISQMDLVTIEIYDLLGQKIRTLIKQIQPSGYHHVQWDGHDDQVNLLPTGIYLCRLMVGKQQSVQKIAFIK
ncbi:MAG TPA: T9SS type A sorting domain-containing protein [bacterium]